MKKFFLLSVVVLQTQMASAALNPENVHEVDKIRAGDVASAAAKYFAKLKPKGCDDPQTEHNSHVLYKLGSNSSIERDNSATYIAKYLALSVCNSSYSGEGAFREVVDSKIIQVWRTGTIKDAKSAVKPTEADQFIVTANINFEPLNLKQ